MSDDKEKQSSREAGWSVDKGQERDLNEDSVGAVNMDLVEGDSTHSVSIFAVADGISGEEHGEVASSMAIHAVIDQIMQNLTSSDVEDDQDYRTWLENAFKTANKELLNDPRHMGTTLLTTIVVANTAFIANVGDSRAYALTKRGMNQITEDQTLLQVLLQSGVIEEDQAIDHPYENILSQAVGKEEELEPDVFSETFDPDKESYLLLCSDGLTKEVNETMIYRTVMQADTPQAACDQLVKMANRSGGNDNISVVIIRF